MTRILTKYLITLLLLLVFSNQTLHAQLSATDSIFLNTHFTEPMYLANDLFPGNWYVHDEVDSIPELFEKLDSMFVFNPSDFDSAYARLQTDAYVRFDTLLNTTFNYYYATYGNAYKQYDPLVTLDFSLQGKSSKAYATYSPTNASDTSAIGFLIIPGSNNNQTTQLILGTGYHNTNCFVRNKLLEFGDVYIQCKPLEDYRALYWNKKKFNSGDYVSPGLNFIYSYLDSIDTPYGINYLTEALALLKHMKSKYRKVMVLGCSQGGYAGLLAALNSPIDGCLVSSGYTKFIDGDSFFLHTLSKNFDSIPHQFTAPLIKNKIEASPGEFLFTWPNYDSYWYQLEHDNHFTENFFSNLSNTSYFYDYTYHSFPTCDAIDTFVQRVLSKPKLFFTVIDSSKTDSVEAMIDFYGSGPVSFELYKNNDPYQSFSLVPNAMQITLREPGTYTIHHIYNMDSIRGYCSDNIYIPGAAPAGLVQIEKSETPYAIQHETEDRIRIRSNLTYTDQLNSPFRVFGMNGQQMVSSRLIQGSAMISTTHWPTGIYLIVIDSKQQPFVYKIQK